MLSRLLDLLDRCDADRQWAASEAFRAEKGALAPEPRRRPRADQHLIDAAAAAASSRSAA